MDAEIISAASVDALTLAIKSDLSEANYHGCMQAAFNLRAGANLIHLKEQLPHGSWRAWLAEHFNLDERTAQRYMKAARLFGKTDNVVGFGWSSILAMLKLPPEDVQSFIARHDVKNMTARKLQAAVRDWLNRNTIDVPASITVASTPAPVIWQPCLPGFEPLPVVVKKKIGIPKPLRDAADKMNVPIVFTTRVPLPQPAVVVTYAKRASFAQLLLGADAVILAGKFLFGDTAGQARKIDTALLYFGDEPEMFLKTFKRFGAGRLLK